MAKLNACIFCERASCDAVCECVIEFGELLERKIEAWKIACGRKPFSDKIKEALNDPRWEAYRVFKGVQDLKAHREKQVKKHLDGLCADFTKKAQREIDKRFGTDEFHVRVEGRSHRVIRYA